MCAGGQQHPLATKTAGLPTDMPMRDRAPAATDRSVDVELVSRLCAAVEDRDARIDELEQGIAATVTELSKAREAIETRDMIGMAKGIIIASLGCTPDEAFGVLAKQSSVEHRKLVEIADEVVRHSQMRSQRPSGSR